MCAETKDKAVFDSIYEKNVGMVFCIALKYIGNYHTAEEITQEAFTKLYAYFDRVNPDKISGWLKVTTKNMALNIKRNKREFLTNDMYNSDFCICHSESSEIEFMEKLRETDIEKFADHLFEELYMFNIRWYEAITLTFILEKPHKETAKAMGLSVAALDSMIYRAKKWLKKKYGIEYKQVVGLF